MRRILILAVTLLLSLSLSISASAATSVSSLGSFATVSADGSCQVTMTVTLHLEQSFSELYFPLPANASNVTVNGSRGWTDRADGVRRVNLSRLVNGAIGDVTVNLHYTMKNLVQRTDSGLLELQLPLLAGFAHPITAMNFSVTLPGAVEAAPGFSSGYHQAEIEKSMTYTVEGATISGSFDAPLKDHETLTLILNVTDTMFPQSVLEIRDNGFVTSAMLICAGVAFLYWLIFLRALPFIRQYCPEPPEGFTAGELGCILNTRGVDLTMMIFSWAQLGYVLIQIGKDDKVYIHKRMDMGNERSETERHYFRKLFSKKDIVNTSSYSYAMLCLTAGKKPAGLQEILRPRSGNVRIFRGIISGIGLFGGIALGNNLGGGALRDVFTILLALCGGISAWVIQDWSCGLLLRDRHKLYLAFSCCGLWLLFGLMGQCFNLCLWIIFGLLFAGLLMAFGGRRTSWGRQLCRQLLGLRHYLRTISSHELQRISQANPDYFYNLAPHAIALGADAVFAKRFGGLKLPDCPYLTADISRSMTASEWMRIMRLAADLMDARSKQIPMEKLIQFIRGLKR